MTHVRAPQRHSQRTLMPFILVVGPLLSALTLTAVGYVMFRAQATAGATGQSATEILFGPLEYTVILALAGALVSLVMAALGLALYGKARKATDAKELALSEGLEGLAALERIMLRIVERGERREAAASAWARGQRDAFARMSAMMGPRAALQRVASDIWAGMSQPGAPLDAPTALRMARESAVAAAALGAALDELRALMATSPAEVDAIEAIDDALIEDLVALEELTRQTRHAIMSAGVEGAAIAGNRTSDGEEPVAVPSFVSEGPEGRLSTGSMERASEGRRDIPRPAGANSRNPQIDERRAPARDAGPAWPPSVESRSSAGQGNGVRDARPAGSSGQWPRQPEDPGGLRGDDSNVRRRGPRDRDDSGSRWLND